MTFRILISLCFASFLIFAAAAFPLKTAGSLAGLDHRLFVSGSLWSGAIDGVPFFGNRGHRITVEGKASALFTLSYKADWKLGGALASGHGAASLSALSDYSIDQAALDITIPADQWDIPLASTLSFTLDHLAITGDRCNKAEGFATYDILARNSSVLNWTGPLLEGPLRCDAGVVEAVLSGTAASGETITATLRLDQNRYSLLTRVSQPSATLLLALVGLGFEEKAGRYERTQTGVLSVL